MNRVQVSVGVLVLVSLLGGYRVLASGDPAVNFSGTIADVVKIPIPRAHAWIHDEQGKGTSELNRIRQGNFRFKLP